MTIVNRCPPIVRVTVEISPPATRYDESIVSPSSTTWPSMCADEPRALLVPAVSSLVLDELSVADDRTQLPLDPPELIARVARHLDLRSPPGGDRALAGGPVGVPVSRASNPSNVSG